MKRLLQYFAVAFLLAGISCKKEKSVHIHCDTLVNDVLPAADEGQVLVPGAFTPNGDGLNDRFRPHGFNIASLKVWLYDGNSEVVYYWDYSQPAPSTNVTRQNKRYYFRVEATTTMGNRIGMCGEVNSVVCYKTGSSANQYTFEDQITPFGFTGVTAETLTTCN